MRGPVQHTAGPLAFLGYPSDAVAGQGALIRRAGMVVAGKQAAQPVGALGRMLRCGK